MISERLKQISNFINDDHDVADIGSDHGLLLVLLSNRNFSHEVLGVENKIGPFSNLEKTVNKIAKNNFKCLLSDGLKDVKGNYKTIVIAGMGYSNLKNILNKDKNLKSREKFVIDCHTNQKEIRNLFYELGYKVEDDKVIFFVVIYYNAIKFEINNDNQTYNSLELKYGPLNIKRKDDIFIQRYNKQLYKVKNLCNSISNLERKKELELEIKELEEIIK